MGQVTTRRAFLSARFHDEDGVTARPPGSVGPDFLKHCTKCGDCASACPEDVIAIAADGFPVFQPSDNPCTFCGECANACPTPALDIDLVFDWPWRAALKLDSCLSMNGVSCRLCQDNCEESAIRFSLQTGGRAKPTLDVAACTGCGLCPTVCPADAISLGHTPQPKMEAVQ
ncbi:ferredoxin-type protein NapF [Ruegeria lacuscaerulensis]|uniref:ferredoxin-type protein NapF n=1 Tax=Ruegeria lacuscaerulensis TaxID=55218 RepID=UPI0014814BDA|nr:ferredoxin-type protein NapF [Ruegeria lacuscaerulensis]